MDEDRVPPELAVALGSLPREAPFSSAEEERTVQALRRRGLLPQPRWQRYSVQAMRIAAALALFIGGTWYGEQRASSRALESMLAQQEQDARTTALLVQRAGSAYMEALGALAVALQSSPQDPTLAGGRDAAVVTVRSAITELQRLAAMSEQSQPVRQATYSF